MGSDGGLNNPCAEVRGPEVPAKARRVTVPTPTVVVRVDHKDPATPSAATSPACRTRNESSNASPSSWRKSVRGNRRGKDPRLRQLRVRHSCTGADLHALRLPRHRARRRVERPHLLLRALRGRGRRYRAARSRLGDAATSGWGCGASSSLPASVGLSRPRLSLVLMPRLFPAAARRNLGSRSRGPRDWFPRNGVAIGHTYQGGPMADEDVTRLPDA